MIKHSDSVSVSVSSVFFHFLFIQIDPDVRHVSSRERML